MSLLPATFTFEIVSPERMVVREDVHEAQIPARGGYLGVLPGHAPLLTQLQTGEVRYRKDNYDYFVAVSGGYAEVLADRVILLAERAERAEEVDVERARKARQRAEARLARLNDPEIDMERARAALARAANRLHVADQHVTAAAAARVAPRPAPHAP
jgi:F-type H+-transporting ATPase subunit epsilon